MGEQLVDNHQKFGDNEIFLKKTLLGTAILMGWDGEDFPYGAKLSVFANVTRR